MCVFKILDVQNILLDSNGIWTERGNYEDWVSRTIKDRAERHDLKPWL